MNYYLIYRNCDGELIATGTARQCARQLKITQASFYSLVSRAAYRKHGKYAVVKQRLNKDDDV